MKYLSKWDFFCVPFLDRVKWEHPITQTIYMWMCRFVWDTDTCYPSRQKLSEVCWCGVRSIDIYIERLVDLEIIEKNRRFKEWQELSSEFKILYPPAGDAIPPAGDADEIYTPYLYIEKKEQILDLLGYEESNDNKIALWLLWKMIEIWYRVECKLDSVRDCLQWFKDKSTIYGYRTMAWDIDWSRFSMQVDKWSEYHKWKKDNIENYRSSLIKFLDTNYQGRWKQKK